MLNFIKVIKKTEKFFLGLAIINFLILILCQAGHLIYDDHFFFEKKLTALNSYTTIFEPIFTTGSITLQVVDKNKSDCLGILLNGEMYDYFRNNIIQLIVRNGDIIELNRKKGSDPVIVKVIETTPNINKPSIQNVFVLTKQQNSLFKVVIE